MGDLEFLLKVRGGLRVRDAVLRARIIRRDRLASYWFRGIPNLGDAIAPHVLAWVTGTEPIWVSRGYHGKTLSAGSVLHAVAAGDTVWGTGSIEDRPHHLPDGVRVLAVRGPLTRALISGDVPEVFGDPALLLSEIYEPGPSRRHQVGVVPHYVDADFVSIEDPAIAVIDVSMPWQEVVDEIVSCDVVVSSSLHGLIVAEVYGVPASWVTISGELRGGEFKFQDYYTATGRDERRPTDWDAGLEAAVRNVAPPLVFDPAPLKAAGREIVAS